MIKRVAKPSDYTLNTELTALLGEDIYTLSFDDRPCPGNPTKAPQEGATLYNKHIQDKLDPYCLNEWEKLKKECGASIAFHIIKVNKQGKSSVSDYISRLDDDLKLTILSHIEEILSMDDFDINHFQEILKNGR